jgi:hypothetical protein
MAVERNFIADDADLLVFIVLLAGVYPRIWYVRLYFFFEVGFVDFIDAAARVECDVLKIA